MYHFSVRAHVGVVAALASLAFAACGDDADARHPFCRAALAAEAATMTEDPAAIEAAFNTAADTAPAELREAVDTVVAEFSAGRAGSPEFTTAYGEITDWAGEECEFVRLAVTASDHAFSGLPDSLDPGPVIVELRNDGTEFHQVMLLRLDDDEQATLEEIIARPEEEILSSSTPVGGAFAAPDGTGTGMFDLAAGRYVAICFLPVGATPQNMPAIEAGEHDGSPHYSVGMVQLLTVS
jgi:hypothetical protein